MPPIDPPSRCRLVLFTPPEPPSDLEARLAAALAAGDVASVILPQYALDEAAFQKFAAPLVQIVQQAGAAAIVAGDTRVASRIGADGLHVDGGKAELADRIEKAAGRMIVGAGGAKTRDDALDLGELQPDYLFFGRFGYDNTAAAHHRNLSLGTWWAEMIEVPCIVMGGNALESATEVAATGAEFVAMSRAIFDASDPAEAVRACNARLSAAAEPVVG